jgi:meso-butanediol dehydrogenase / (S,S)-butanediol dehydrogenase / diacetyl reductase
MGEGSPSVDTWGIEGRLALVTGASSGIGRATVQRLSTAGCSVAALGRDEEALAAVVDDVGPERCRAFSGELADPASVRATVRAALAWLGGVDIVVNNAGVGFRADILSTTEEQWDLTFAVNVRAPFLVCQETLPSMLERGGGAIVNIASVGGLIGIPARAAYGASKAALISLTRSLTVDYASRGIRANCLAPGTTETPWVDRIIAGADEPAALRRQMAERQIVGRLGTAEEIADAVLFLVSDRAGFFHGSTVVVDGGYSAR